MILFCDTSALVKLYVVEPQSDQMHALVAEAEAVAVVRIAWAEFHAALARRAREVPADAPAVDDARRALAVDWTHYLILEVGQSLVERAGEFADAFALRGYDAIQLAAAHELATEAERPVAFACADHFLRAPPRSSVSPCRCHDPLYCRERVAGGDPALPIRKLPDDDAGVPARQRRHHARRSPRRAGGHLQGSVLGLGATVPAHGTRRDAAILADRAVVHPVPPPGQGLPTPLRPEPPFHAGRNRNRVGQDRVLLAANLDYCAGRPEQGVRAVIVYPMNALAADQARRFARDIHDRKSLRGRVSVGLYVGDSGPSVHKVMSRDSVITCRETLREYPPDILLTNYKMLDFLLLRPRDQRLWRHNEPGRLRYLVVDELHTFDGAQGTDLACLVRRLRDRLLPGEGLACVGTSATLGGESAGQELVDYASQVFASPFDADAVVMENRETPEEFLAGAEVRFTNWPTTGTYGGGYAQVQDAAVDNLRKLAMRWFGGDAPALDARDQAVAMQARFQLAERLRECRAFRELLERAPGLLDVNAVVADWAQRFRIEPAQARQMLDSLLALVSWARRPNDPHATSTDDPGQPFVTLRLQLWLRELSRLVANVGFRPMLRFADDLTDLASPLHLPVVHCRECHATGWLSVRKADEGRLETDLQSIYRSYFGNHPEMCLLFPLEGTPAAEPKGIEGAICPQCGQLLPKAGATQCPHCKGDAPLVPVWEPNMRRTQARGDLNVQRSHHDCPFCGAHEGLSLIGSRAASLASVLIGRLCATPYNDHRKLIAFSDAVQDAAHRAGFFGARTYSTLIRGAIARFVTAQGEGLPLSVVASEMPRYWRNRTGSEARFVGTFIAPNMEWLRDYEYLKTQCQLPPHSAVPGWVEQRLTWEVLQAFGLRARIGRTLERSRVAAVGPDPVALRESAARLAQRLSEEIGSLRGIGETAVLRYLLGFLWRMRVGGAFYHPTS